MKDLSRIIEKFNEVDMFRYCEQCGRCSSACPLTGINGFNIRRLIRHVECELIDEISKSPMPWFCAACGRCEDACPNGIKILDITRLLRMLGPDDMIPDTPLCVKACPAKIDIPGYLRLISKGKMEEACELIMERAPFPGILGRICTHPCETACKRGEINEAVSICAAKRYAADKAEKLPERIFQMKPETGHRVAVIGAGPSGLTAAFYLKKKGHGVTIFEAMPRAGGMMRYGIPRYRLPEDVIDKEIGRILDMGIELRTDTKIGIDFNIDKLKQEGFEAVYIAVGAQLSKRISLEGMDLGGVLWGVDFLFNINKDEKTPMKEKVMVIGGGNVAIDVALTSLRMGAKEVTMACLESREEMPADPWEIQMAEEEGIELLYSWGPERIMGKNGEVTGVELVRCTSVFDDKGDFCPFFEDTKKHLKIDQVILAIGQASETEFCKDFCFLDNKGSLTVENGLISINTKTQETEITGVFAGGDVANGPGSVITAIAAGRRAAKSIDSYLDGDGIMISSSETDRDNVCQGPSTLDYTGKRDKSFADLQRKQTKTLPVSERFHGFAEVDLGFSDEDAVWETNRCLQCDLELCLARLKTNSV